MMPTTTRYAASAACSTISAPSPATRSATTAPTPTSPCSPNPPPTNAAPSTSSTPPSPSPSPRSQNKHPPKRLNPRPTQEITYPNRRNFGLAGPELVFAGLRVVVPAARRLRASVDVDGLPRHITGHLGRQKY